MNDPNIAERLRQQALAGLGLVRETRTVAPTKERLPGLERKENISKVLCLPDGWEEAVDAWVRASCPKGDPIMLGLNLTALNRLAQLPREQRPTALRAWRRQFQERKCLAELSQ